MTSTTVSTAERIRALNDASRRTFVGGTIMITAGEAVPLDQRRSLLAEVPSFEDFDEDFSAQSTKPASATSGRSTAATARPRWARPTLPIPRSRRVS